MPRIQLFDMEFDAILLPEAGECVLQWARARENRMVVTPNVDHLVLVSSRPELLPIYRSADLVLADGQPLIWASWLLGSPLASRVAGSDLFPAVLRQSQARPGLRVFLFGGRDGVPELAAKNIARDYPWVNVVGWYSPPFGFENQPQENERAVTAVASADADVVLVALGAPKQEQWVHRERARLSSGVLLCLGATIDFVAGTIPRAPHWMQRNGLEWAFRVAGEPRRLAKRYAKDALVFPQLVAREYFARRRARRLE